MNIDKKTWANLTNLGAVAAFAICFQLGSSYALNKDSDAFYSKDVQKKYDKAAAALMKMKPSPVAQTPDSYEYWRDAMPAVLDSCACY